LYISVLYICIVVGDQLLRGEDWISLTDLVSARFCAYPKTEFGFPSMFSLVLFVCIDFRREAVVRFVYFGGMVVNHCFHRNLDRNVHQFWCILSDFVATLTFWWDIVSCKSIELMSLIFGEFLIVLNTIYCRSSNDASYRPINQ